MQFISWGESRLELDPNLDILEQLKYQLDAKVSGDALLAAVGQLEEKIADGDEDAILKSAVVLEEEDPESGTHNGYVLKQGGLTIGHIHTPSIIKNAYLEKDGDITYLVLEFEGAVDPVKIDVSSLIDLYTGSTGDMIKVSVSADNIISAEVLDSSITRSKVAEDIEASLQKADGAQQYTDEQVAAEKSERQSEDTRIEGLVDAEKERAISKEEELQAAITAEEEARIAGDNELDVKIRQEVSERIAADEQLQSAINQEVDDRKAADQELDEKIDDEVAARILDVEEETERASSKEAEIEEALTTEITRSKAKMMSWRLHSLQRRRELKLLRKPSIVHLRPRKKELLGKRLPSMKPSMRRSPIEQSKTSGTLMKLRYMLIMLSSLRSKEESSQ